MHLPEFALLTRTLGSFSSFLRLRMDRVQRKVPKDVSNLTRVDVGFTDLRERLTDVSGAVRSLKVRVLYHGHRRIG